MRKKNIVIVLPLLLAAAGPLKAQDTHISCGQIATLPDEALTLYLGGLMDGIGLSFSISNTTATVLTDRAVTDGEKASIEQMRRLPQEYFDPGQIVTRADMVTAVMARCKVAPDLAVDSVFLDVLAKN